MSTRFRRLTTEELEELEKEFVQFLAVNGIEAQDWENAKVQNPEFCSDKIDEFSDVIIGTVMSSAGYAEHVTKNEWMLFRFESDRIRLIILNSSTVNFLEDSLSNVNLKEIEIFKSHKEYSRAKEDELFQMIQHGCVLSDGKVFESLY